MAQRYFADIPAAPRPAAPDVAEPEWTSERRFEKDDALANRPAVAVSYRVPERDSPSYFAMGLIDQAPLQGDDSALSQELVTRRGLTGSIDGGMNFLGNMFNAQTPLLWTASLIHDDICDTDTVLEAFDSALAPILAAPLSTEAFDRAVVKARSSFYDSMSGSAYPGFGRADLLASFAMIDGDANRINDVDSMFSAVTPELVHRVAIEYLRPDRRVVLTVKPSSTINSGGE
jgi:predicted Zn-dependent peptidase